MQQIYVHKKKSIKICIQYNNVRKYICMQVLIKMCSLHTVITLYSDPSGSLSSSNDAIDDVSCLRCFCLRYLSMRAISLYSASSESITKPYFSYLANVLSSLTAVTYGKKCFMTRSMPWYSVLLDEGHVRHAPSIANNTTPLISSKFRYLTSPPSRCSIGRTCYRRSYLMHCTTYESLSLHVKSSSSKPYYFSGGTQMLFYSR